MSGQTTASDFCEQVLAGDRRALARAATLIEAQAASGLALLKAVFAHTGRASILGITGPPGAGKSTLVDQLITRLRAQAKTVGVLAVDPSSPFSRGAILGDRIRMQDHHADSGVFIRSMAARGRLGGVAKCTLDLALLLDAGGFDMVLIETVGVGQGEIEIAQLADLTLLVLVPGMGDDVQAIKAGTMEIADLFVINKSDQPGAEKLEQQIHLAQMLGGETARQNLTPIRRIVATTGEGMTDLMATLEELLSRRAKQGERTRRWQVRLQEMLEERFASAIPEEVVQEHARRVAEKMEDPYAAVECMVERVLKAWH